MSELQHYDIIYPDGAHFIRSQREDTGYWAVADEAEAAIAAERERAEKAEAKLVMLTMECDGAEAAAGAALARAAARAERAEKAEAKLAELRDAVLAWGCMCPLLREGAEWVGGQEHLDICPVPLAEGMRDG